LLAQDATVEDVEVVEHPGQSGPERLLCVPHASGGIESRVCNGPPLGAEDQVDVFLPQAVGCSMPAPLILPGILGGCHASIDECSVLEGLVHCGEVVCGPWHVCQFSGVCTEVLHKLVDVLDDPISGWLAAGPGLDIFAAQRLEDGLPYLYEV
jgi:hypothetical protein